MAWFRKIGWSCTRGHANLDEERKCWGCAFRVRWLYKPVDWRRVRAYEVIKKNRRRARKPLYGYVPPVIASPPCPRTPAS